MPTGTLVINQIEVEFDTSLLLIMTVCFSFQGDDESEGFRLTLPTHGTSAVGPGFHLKF